MDATQLKIENVTRAKVTSTKRIEQNLMEPVALREAVVLLWGAIYCFVPQAVALEYHCGADLYDNRFYAPFMAVEKVQ